MTIKPKLAKLIKIKVDKVLAKDEREYEKLQQTTQRAWYLAGLRMLKIRNEKRYEATYKTFNNYLDKRWTISEQHGYRMLTAAEFMLKLTAPKLTQNSELGEFFKPVLPDNERQLRPLLTALNHDGERLHVWQKVVQAGEKRTAVLVQRMVDEFKASGEIVEDVEEVKVVIPNNVHVGKNSGENEWYTPAKYIEAARAVMGGIDCDPATSELANLVVQAATIFTAEDDGRAQTWRGRVWMNPPYAQPLMGDFAEAVSSKYESGEIEQACILVNNATETAWFQRMLSVASAVCFPKSRIKFMDPEGKPSGSPLQGQAIVYMGDNVHGFEIAFRAEGVVLFVSS